ncbi:MAG: polyprenyl synthetase family protein [Ignavibacteria bacterium]|nr:polyprenyl synthetase family protein [Ignavibacteria bacterium]
MNDYSIYRSTCEEHLQLFVEKQIQNSSGNYTNESLGNLHEAVRYVLSGGGKRIRPILLMLTTEAFGGNIQDCLDAATAVEILHNFTLVHDDIMDNALTRRGRATVHTKYDVNSAILVGDELIALSYRSLLNTKSSQLPELIKIFTNGVIEVCEGQAMDKHFEVSNEVSLDDYKIMIRKKTAEMLEVSASLGAIIAGASAHEVQMMRNYAENLGIAFQINDDLLDVTAEENDFGKKIGSDIIEKKKTYLYLKTMEILSENNKQKLFELYQIEDLDLRVQEVINFYRNICVIESAREEITRYTDVANSFLSVVTDQKSRKNLEQFSDMLLNRIF